MFGSSILLSSLSGQRKVYLASTLPTTKTSSISYLCRFDAQLPFSHQVRLAPRSICHGEQLAFVKSFRQIPSPDPSSSFLSVASQLCKYLSKRPLFKLHEENREKYHRYGPIVRETHFWQKPIVQIFYPEDFEKVFRHQGRCPLRPPNEFAVQYRENNPDLYSSVGISNLLGEEWLKKRLMIAPVLLSPGVVNSYLPKQDKIATDFVKYLRLQSLAASGSIEDLLEATNRYSVESISMITLNSRLGCLSRENQTQDGDKLINVTKELFEAYQELYHGFPLWKYVKTRSFKKFCEAEGEIYDLVSKYIVKAISAIRAKDNRASIQADSLLNKLLCTPGLQERDVRILIIDFIAGGINTVSTTLCFLLHHLASNSISQEKLRKEILSVIEPNQPINSTHLSKLPYLKACLKESFRLASVIPNLVRILSEPIVLSGYEVPENIPIIINFDVCCKDKKYFEKPESFSPERWLGEARQKIHPFSLLPFGLGNRMCAGRRISEIELYLAVIRIILDFHLISETEAIDLRQDFIIVPDNKIRIKLVPRHGE